MEDDDTVTGGDELTLDEAVSAYVKQDSEGAEQGQPEEELQPEGDETADDDELNPEDEDDSEAEGDLDDEGDPDDEDEAEPESDGGRFVASNGKVRLPDGTVSTVEDLIGGNLRDKDYRQKTMQHADEVRAFKEQSSAFEASEKQLRQEREYINTLLQSIKPQAPDRSMLDSDPVEYMRQKEQFEQFQQHEQYLKYQTEQQKQQETQQAQEQRLKRADEEWGILQEVVPEFRDNAKSQMFADDLKKYGQEYGFSIQEIAETVPLDHRQALVMRDAIKWRKLQANKAKVQKKVDGRPPVARGGKRPNKNAQRSASATDAMKRLKQSGSVEDATAAYLANLNKG